MSYDSAEKKPREMFINIGIEAGSNLDVIWNADEQTLSYRATKEGKPTKLITSIGTSYYRPKKPKILNMMPASSKENPTFSFDEALSAFDTVFAVDTNYLDYDGDKICVTCIVAGRIELTDTQFVGIGQARCCLEFWNPLGNEPEKIGWKKAIQTIQKWKRYDVQHRYAFIVDSYLNEIPQYNLYLQPVLEDFYLPKNFKMFYASSDGGKEYFPNKLISLSDKTARKILDFVGQHKWDRFGNGSTSEEDCTFFRIWTPTEPQASIYE